MVCHRALEMHWMRITRRSRTCVDAAPRASQFCRLEHHCISNKSKSKGRWKVSRLRTKSRTKMVEWQVFGQSRTTDALEQALLLTRRLEAIVKKAPSALTIRSHCSRHRRRRKEQVRGSSCLLWRTQPLHISLSFLQPKTHVNLVEDAHWLADEF